MSQLRLIAVRAERLIYRIGALPIALAATRAPSDAQFDGSVRRRRARATRQHHRFAELLAFHLRPVARHCTSKLLDELDLTYVASRGVQFVNRRMHWTAAAALLAGSAALGQGSGSKVADLERGSWPVLTIGQTISGSLSSGDAKRDDGTYTDPFFYDAAAGESVTITMRSSDLDSWLVVDDPSGSMFQHDDDSGGGRDAQLTLTFPHAGRYLILANTVSPGAVGNYTLVINRYAGTAPVPAGTNLKTIEQGSWPLLSAGQTIAGSLATSDIYRDDGTYTDPFFYNAAAGETITVTMRSSDLDSWLVIDDPSGALNVHDDDSGGGHDAQITITFPHAGRYLILANTVMPRSTGDYTLSVSH